jgi:hypothetical protein
MSRAYRVKVSESLSRVLKASDHVSTQMQILEVLPREAMAEILEAELKKRGFQNKDGKLVREEKGGITISVDPGTATVTVAAEGSEGVRLSGSREGWADDDWGRRGGETVKEALKDEVRKDLERKAEKKTEELQKKVTDKLEGKLLDLRKELDAIVNKVTADALKQKAASLGSIKSITEDEANGSMTIVLEV